MDVIGLRNNIVTATIRGRLSLVSSARHEAANLSRAVAKSTDEIVAERDHPCMPRWVDPAAVEQAQKFAL